jgi:uncharacterized protein Yka (UPF0111/DUF47 family)
MRLSPQSAIMFSLQKLFGRDEVFFDLLEKSATEAQHSVQLMRRMLQNPADPGTAIAEFSALRKKDKQITEEIRTQLTQTFVTPLEREDIEALANALYKIPKTLEKFGERLQLATTQVTGTSFAKQAELLDTAIQTVVQMVRELRKPNLGSMKELNGKLQHLEGAADNLMLDLLRGLYAGDHDAVRVIALKDLYELLEKVIDRCRDAGNVIFHIVLKNS